MSERVFRALLEAAVASAEQVPGGVLLTKTWLENVKRTLGIEVKEEPR